MLVDFTADKVAAIEELLHLARQLAADPESIVQVGGANAAPLSAGGSAWQTVRCSCGDNNGCRRHLPQLGLLEQQHSHPRLIFARFASQIAHPLGFVTEQRFNPLQQQNFFGLNATPRPGKCRRHQRRSADTLNSPPPDRWLRKLGAAKVGIQLAVKRLRPVSAPLGQPLLPFDRFARPRLQTAQQFNVLRHQHLDSGLTQQAVDSK